MKIKPVAGATPVPLPKASCRWPENYSGPEWSPAGDWILYPSADGMSLASPDGASNRKLTSRKLSAYGFSRDGRQVYGVFQNTTGSGAPWQLYSIDVASGVEKMLAPLDLPAFGRVDRRFQHAPRRPALSHLDRQVALRHLDAGGLRSAALENLARTAPAALTYGFI